MVTGRVVLQGRARGKAVVVGPTVTATARLVAKLMETGVIAPAKARIAGAKTAAGKEAVGSSTWLFVSGRTCLLLSTAVFICSQSRRYQLFLSIAVSVSSAMRLFHKNPEPWN